MIIFANPFKNLIRRQDGVTALEYALLGALIAVIIVGAVTNVGLNVQELFRNVADEVTAVVAKVT